MTKAGVVGTRTGLLCVIVTFIARANSSRDALPAHSRRNSE